MHEWTSLVFNNEPGNCMIDGCLSSYLQNLSIQGCLEELAKELHSAHGCDFSNITSYLAIILKNKDTCLVAQTFFFFISVLLPTECSWENSDSIVCIEHSVWCMAGTFMNPKNLFYWFSTRTYVFVDKSNDQWKSLSAKSFLDHPSSLVFSVLTSCLVIAIL